MSTPPRGNDALFPRVSTTPGSGDAVPDVRPADVALAQEHAARVCAEATVFSRDRVLSLVSHDLRGPLNAIHSWAHVLERKLAVEDPGIARAIAGIRTGVEQQVKLIEDVIDRTRQQTRHLTLALTSTSLLSCVQAELDAIDGALAPADVGVVQRALRPIDGVTATLDAPRYGQALWTVVMYALAQRHAGTVVEVGGSQEGDRIELAVVFTPLPDATAPDAGLTPSNTPSGEEALFASYAAFMNAPKQLDNGMLPLALPQRVAAAHGGELIDETLADGRRRLALRQPLHARPPQY